MTIHTVAALLSYFTTSVRVGRGQGMGTLVHRQLQLRDYPQALRDLRSWFPVLLLSTNILPYLHPQACIQTLSSSQPTTLTSKHAMPPPLPQAVRSHPFTPS